MGIDARENEVAGGGAFRVALPGLLLGDGKDLFIRLRSSLVILPSAGGSIWPRLGEFVAEIEGLFPLP